MKLPGPDHPITIVPADKRVTVTFGGETIAETRDALVLREAALPPVYYVPRDDARMDLLQRTERRTRCPYKGEARYWSIDAGGVHHDDIAWSYPAPIPECPKIEQLVAFYDERVDAVYVDGERQPVPETRWSRRR